MYIPETDPEPLLLCGTLDSPKSDPAYIIELPVCIAAGQDVEPELYLSCSLGLVHSIENGCGGDIDAP